MIINNKFDVLKIEKKNQLLNFSNPDNFYINNIIQMYFIELYKESMNGTSAFLV